MISSKILAKHIDSGYITMNSQGKWMWWPNKPEIDDEEHWCSYVNILSGKCPCSLDLINIKPVKNWKKSLIKCGE